MAEPGDRDTVELETEPRFGSGTLLERVRERAAQALRAGAVEPIPTEVHVIPDRGVRFAVRVVRHLERKREQARTQRQSGSDPFLPYDPRLFVAEVSATHLCLLNKFNVLPHHLLIVTRGFEDQERPLTEADFHALWACLVELGGLGFYNGGEGAGASQRHKHLQLVATPVGAGPEAVPIETHLAAARDLGEATELATLPFAHAVVGLRAIGRRLDDAARGLLRRYRELLACAGVTPGRTPYNLLLTRSWMFVVARSRECFGSISVNALGFAGSLLARDREELERIRRAGPMRVLTAVGVKRRPGAGARSSAQR